MIVRRPAEERGVSRLGWLDSRHTFSFNQYYDPEHMGFRSLRVINEDRVTAGGGFPTHPHRDMEILTHVLEGELEHRDSMGNGSVLHRGELQRMTAGSGITHSEFNRSRTDPLHFLQVWVLPDHRGLAPEYEQRAVPLEENRGRLVLVASPDGRDGSLRLHQDAELLIGVLSAEDRVGHSLEAGRHAWVQVARGAIDLDGVALRAGDGAAVSGAASLDLVAGENAEILVFDLA